MSALGELLSYCYESETKARKAETEKRLFPLWLVSYALSQLSGVMPGMEPVEAMPYDEYIKTVLDGQEQPKKEEIKRKGPEEILAEFAPIIEAERGG